MQLQIIEQEKKRFLPLLLLADPEEAMIDRYLEEGTLFVLSEEQREIAVAVVLGLSATECELKNLAVAQDLQGQGYGSILVQQLCLRYRKQYETMLVGTSQQGTAFYRRLGFIDSHIKKNFFLEHYSQPIWENGRLCKDMYYLKRSLV